MNSNWWPLFVGMRSMDRMQYGKIFLEPWRWSQFCFETSSSYYSCHVRLGSSSQRHFLKVCGSWWLDVGLPGRLCRRRILPYGFDDCHRILLTRRACARQSCKTLIISWHCRLLLCVIASSLFGSSKIVNPEKYPLLLLFDDLQITVPAMAMSIAGGVLIYGTSKEIFQLWTNNDMTCLSICLVCWPLLLFIFLPMPSHLIFPLLCWGRLWLLSKGANTMDWRIKEKQAQFNTYRQLVLMCTKNNHSWASTCVKSSKKKN